MSRKEQLKRLIADFRYLHPEVTDWSDSEVFEAITISLDAQLEKMPAPPFRLRIIGRDRNGKNIFMKTDGK